MIEQVNNTPKAFSQQEFDENDPEARRVIKEFFLKKWGIILKDNPKKFDVDLLTLDGLHGVEVERRPPWVELIDDCLFPYSTVHMLYRKKKYMNGEGFNHCVVSSGYKYFMYIPKRVLNMYLTKKFLVEIPNVKVPENEWFYDIPRQAFQIYEFSTLQKLF